jgi:hypothetical protein
VPIALAIWIASFLAVPAAVLVHEAVSSSDSGTSVENAAETRTGDGQQPAGEQAPTSGDASGSPARSTGGGAGSSAGAAAVPGQPGTEVVDQADPGAPGAPGVPGPSTALVSSTPATGGQGSAPVPGGARPTASSSAANTAAISAAASSSSSAAAATSSASAVDPAPTVEPPVEAQQQALEPGTP